MKRLFTFLTIMTATLLLFAQSPEKMSYQAVIRNSSDVLVTNTLIGMEINIRQGSASGTVVYTETHTPTTNSNGLVSIEIGGGAVFNTIDWSAGPYFIETKTDPTGGTNYTITGTSQLLSVPYALHAKSAETVTGGITETDPVFGVSPANGITNTNISNWNSAYGWGDHSAAGYLTSEVDGSVTNELQVLSISNDTIRLSNGGYAKLPAGFSGDYNDLTNKPTIPTVPTNVSEFTNDAGYLTSFTETDPLWTAASSGYYTKTQMQTSGQSQLHWNNVTNKPTTLADYGAELDPTWGGTNDETGDIFRTGNVGIGSTSTPPALLYTYGIGSGGGNVLFVGSYKFTSPGNPPATGYGTRMMWYPDKAAFRVGYVSGPNWDKDSIGVCSFAAGSSTKAKGRTSTAMGAETTASGDYSTSLGYITTASGNYSIAMGDESKASGEYSTAMGRVTTASGEYSTAMGLSSQATGFSSTSMGVSTIASGQYSTAMGNSTVASGDFSTAMGNNTTAPSFNELVIGRHNTTYTPKSTTAWNTADRLFVIGNGTNSWSPSDAMVVLKNGNVGIGGVDTAALLYTYGDDTGCGNVLFAGTYKSSFPGTPPASGAGTRMMWYPDKAAFRVGGVDGSNWNKDSIGDYSFAAGNSTKAKGSYSTAIGIGTTASGLASTSMGYVTTASGQASTSIGQQTTASGNFSIATGYYTTASGNLSTAMGNVTIASGENSTALGIYTNASGQASMAMGHSTYATGNYSTAMGHYANASGENSTALGYNTTASGQYSTAMGYNTNAYGNLATAMGNFATAHSFNELVIGRYNTTYTPLSSTDWNTNDRLFVIGNGTSSTRSDAMVVLKNGNVGLGTSNPARTLHVNSVMRLQPTSTAPASPAEGDMYMNATTHKLMVYDGTTWQACW